MNPIQIRLSTDLVFKGNNPREQAIALIESVPNPLHRGDILQFANGEQLAVIFKSGHRVEFLRKSERKFRRIGGLAYRKWARAAYEHESTWEEDYSVPPPKRARPFLRQRIHWPAIHLPAGMSAVVTSQAFAEGTAS